MSEKIVPNRGATINDYMRQQSAIGANLYVGFNDHAGANGCPWANLGRRMNDGCGMSAARIERWLIKELRRAQVSILRVPGAQSRLVYSGKVFLHNDGRSPRGFGRRRVFRIGDKSELARPGGLNGGNSGDIGVRIRRLQLDSQFTGYFLKLHDG